MKKFSKKELGKETKVDVGGLKSPSKKSSTRTRKVAKKKKPEPKLSVVTPFRDEGVAPWYIVRITELIESFPKNSEIEFIVVDSGSTHLASKNCKKICEENGVAYLFYDTRGRTFSPGAARDFGAEHATGKTITFFDIDLRFPTDFWDRVLSFINIYGVSEYKKRVATIPALYLTEDGTNEFLKTKGNEQFQVMLMKWLRGDTQHIQQFAPCTSVGLVDRLHYLSIGGHNPIFEGHGFEDFELYHRLSEEAGEFEKPDAYLKDTKTWGTYTYNGFRSRLSLLGRAAMHSNLFVIHLWHPRPKDASFYQKDKMKATRTNWVKVFEEFDRNNDHPTPLVPSNNSKKVLIFGQPNTNVTRCLRDATPLMGSPIYAKEYDFTDDDGQFLETTFEESLHHNNIKCVLFSSPYGNPAREQVYQWCKKTSFPYLVFERGALPDSWFFDQNGFNADSASYDAKNWDKPLSNKDKTKVMERIDYFLTGEKSLEAQGDRIGGMALAEKLHIGGKKVLFVPLQRPSDTVIRHMAGRVGSCQNFLELIDQTACLLNRMGWIVLCKKHPLETESPSLRYAQYVPDDTHFLDLLELAQSVAVINSGVGLYAMMMGRPCHIFGNSFYAIEGVNQTINEVEPEAIRDQIIKGHKVKRESVLRFMNYLCEEFYSFGVSKTISRKEIDGSLRTVTKSIDFYDLKVPGEPRALYKKDDGAALPKSAPILERYGLDLFQKRKSVDDSKTNPNTSKAIKKSVNPPSSPDKNYDAKSKMLKLRNNPGAFFKDSKIPIIRPLHHLF